MAQNRILIIGLGDLGKRIIYLLIKNPAIAEVLIVARHFEAGAGFARLANACGDVKVRIESCNVLDIEAMNSLISKEKPSLIVQCGSLLSPWLVYERNDETARILREAGLAIQLAAQLPLITSLMLALQQSGFDCPVVNCSYPDITHPVLHRLNLAPTIGIGNAGMIHRLLVANLQNYHESDRLRVFAHHAHVRQVVKGRNGRQSNLPLPRLFLGQSPIHMDDLSIDQTPIPMNRELNALSAFHADEVITALLPDSNPIYTAAPGPFGLPGGWPVKLGNGKASLDLPEHFNMEDMIIFQQEMGKIDGVDRIENDGTVYLTEQVRESILPICPSLAEPLHPLQSLERMHLLSKLIGNLSHEINN
jgi:hypothetical protein